MNSYQYKLLIGGLGDDAHSIGIRLLELGFREKGFCVTSIGIRNTIDAFFEFTEDHDIFLISNKNGHSELYLDRFPQLLSGLKARDDSPKLWYLGGSLSVSQSDFQVKKKYLDMGFTNVYPRPIVFHAVLDDITRDIHRHEIKKKYIYQAPKRTSQDPSPLDYSLIRDRKWTIRELVDMRKQVLREWHTGSEVLSSSYFDLTSQKKTLDNVLWANHLDGKTPLFQPRTGVADIKEQIEMLRYLEMAGSDISSVQLDSASRSKYYDKATIGREMSLEQKRSLLNGFPIPIYGVDQVRKLVLSTKAPFQLRGGGADHRFTYEIALKAGMSGVEGGFVCYLLPYEKICDPVQSLTNWQYVDRLCAYYYERHDVTVNREYFGVLTASLITPSLAIVVNIIQSILSAQQGCKSITVGYAEQGNRSQDIAAVREMKELVPYYLHLFNYRGLRVTTVFHQFMSAFPSDYGRAMDLIYNSSITATLAGATKVMVKTAVEAIGIPDKFENEKALKKCRIAACSAGAATVSYRQVDIEREMIRKEVKQIMDAVIELGNNSVGVGAIKAIECGIIDIPWSPNIYNRNRVMGIRDIDGAVRYLDFGNLPFTEEIKQFHQEKVAVRQMMERDSNAFSLLEKDLSRIWKNDYRQWPLDKNYIS